MAKGRHFRLEDDQFGFLELEAEKRHCTPSEALRQILNDIIKGNPVLTAITGIEQQREQEKLGIETERHRKLKNDNDFFDKHGYYPTKPANFVTRVVETPQPRQTEWTGNNYQKQQTPQQPQKETTYEPEISLEDWKLVFPALTDFDKTKNMYFCIIESCHHGCQNAETARRHIVDNHEPVLQDSLRQMKRMMSK